MGGRSAAVAKAPPLRSKEEILAWAVEYLGKATCEQAVDLYEDLFAMPEMNDWIYAELGKVDLYFLLVHILRRPDVGHEWVYARCRELEASPDGHLDLWARFHYKSTCITFGLTVQDILRNPEATFGIFSHNRPGAKAFMRQIKVEFEMNETLKALYPDILWANPKAEAPKWSEDEGIVVKRKGNPKEATVEAWGLVDGMPTGKHFTHRVYDDIVTETSVTSPVMMEKTTAALELSYALGTEDGIERFIGTRYHFNDSYRTLIERGSVNVRLHDGTLNNCGDIRKPVLWRPEFMASMRKKMGTYTFACQILQNPKADATHGFKREWLEHWAPDKGAGLNIYLLRDPASEKKEQSDYTTDWVVGLGPDENYYILAVYRDRLNLTERTEQLFRLHKAWKPIEVRYEHYGMQGDVEHIESEMKRLKYRFKIHKVAGIKSKADRIKRLIPLFEAHRVILPHQFFVTTMEHETKDMIHEFVENEYMAFPVPVHDDMLDALSRICDTEAHIGSEKVKLALKWPQLRYTKPDELVEYLPLDRGMGM